MVFPIVWKNQPLRCPTHRQASFVFAMNGKVSMEKVMKTIEVLETSDEWQIYVETLAEVLNELIAEVRKEIGKDTRTASLRYTGIIPNIKEKISLYSKVTFNGEIVEILKIINYFLKPYKLQIHPIGSKGLFVSRIETNKGTLVDELESRFRKKLEE